MKVHRKPATTLPPESSSHDRTKQHLLPDGQRCAFLEAIGVMTSEGRVKASRQAKFRQVNRFLELVDDCVGSLPEAGDLQVVDFGCGKSYLTFALYHLLTELRGREVRIVGIERESEVVEASRAMFSLRAVLAMKLESTWRCRCTPVIRRPTTLWPGRSDGRRE